MKLKEGEFGLDVRSKSFSWEPGVPILQRPGLGAVGGGGAEPMATVGPGGGVEALLTPPGAAAPLLSFPAP